MGDDNFDTNIFEDIKSKDLKAKAVKLSKNDFLKRVVLALIIGICISSAIISGAKIIGDKIAKINIPSSFVADVGGSSTQLLQPQDFMSARQVEEYFGVPIQDLETDKDFKNVYVKIGYSKVYSKEKLIEYFKKRLKEQTEETTKTTAAQ